MDVCGDRNQVATDERWVRQDDTVVCLVWVRRRELLERTSVVVGDVRALFAGPLEGGLTERRFNLEFPSSRTGIRWRRRGSGSRSVNCGVIRGGARPKCFHGETWYVWARSPQNAGKSSTSRRTHGSTLCWAYVGVSGAAGGSSENNAVYSVGVRERSRADASVGTFTTAPCSRVTIGTGGPDRRVSVCCCQP